MGGFSKNTHFRLLYSFFHPFEPKISDLNKTIFHTRYFYQNLSSKIQTLASFYTHRRCTRLTKIPEHQLVLFQAQAQRNYVTTSDYQNHSNNQTQQQNYGQVNAYSHSNNVNATVYGTSNVISNNVNSSSLNSNNINSSKINSNNISNNISSSNANVVNSGSVNCNRPNSFNSNYSYGSNTSYKTSRSFSPSYNQSTGYGNAVPCLQSSQSTAR